MDGLSPYNSFSYTLPFFFVVDRGATTKHIKTPHEKATNAKPLVSELEKQNWE